MDLLTFEKIKVINNPHIKVHVANMGSTWVLSAQVGPHVGPMNLAIRELHEEGCKSRLALSGWKVVYMQWNSFVAINLQSLFGLAS